MDDEFMRDGENENCCGGCSCDEYGEDSEVSDERGSVAQKKINELESEIHVLKDTLLRKIAESENLRKRLEKEKDEAIKYSNNRFARDLLVVLDNFDKVSENFPAISAKTDEDQTLRAFFDGVILCGKELMTVFNKNGLSKVNVSVGDAFDPNYHQAMCELESKDNKPGTILQIFQAGYVHNDRLLRPTMVSVSKSVPNEQ
ncbi:protein GrpE [Alphaproteobacteria bacterium]|nr:protein GrpE [Alphaproteobacteria bacterium]